MRSSRPDSVLLEITIVVVASFFLLFLAAYFPGHVVSPSLALVAFLYPPLLVVFLKKTPPKHFGLIFSRPEKKEWELLLKASVLLLPYGIAFHFWQTQVAGQSYHPEEFPHALKILWYLVLQVVVIAFPEELFFRGYLQTRLLDSSWWKGRIVGAILLSNGLFALSHLVGNFHMGRLLPFFPGLIFAWLWHRTHSLFVPIAFHALCNTTLFVLVSLYGR